MRPTGPSPAAIGVGAGTGTSRSMPRRRTGRVVVRQLGGEDPVKVAAVPDQSPVEALGPDGAYPPFRVCVGPRSQLHRMRTVGTDVSG
jgi:hypothetical protein